MTFNDLAAFAGRAVAVGLGVGLGLVLVFGWWSPAEAGTDPGLFWGLSWQLIPTALAMVAAGFASLVLQIWRHVSKEDDWQRWREEVGERTPAQLVGRKSR